MAGVIPPHPQQSCVPCSRLPFVLVRWGRSAKGPVGSPLGGWGDSTLGAGQETLTLPFPSPPATLAALKSDNSASDEVSSQAPASGTTSSRDHEGMGDIGLVFAVMEGGGT